ISVGELWGYFTRYTYLPRLVRREVLDDAIQKAVTTVLVRGECFGIATSKDTESGRYRGLMVPPMDSASIQVTDSTLLVDVEKANKQIEADNEAAREAAAQQTQETQASTETAGSMDFARTEKPKSETDGRATLSSVESEIEAALARFFGSVKIDPDRYSRDIGNVTREVIDRLSGAGAHLEITIDIQATKPGGFEEA